MSHASYSTSPDLKFSAGDWIFWVRFFEMGLSASAPKGAVVNWALIAFFHFVSNSLFPISISLYVMQPDLVKAPIQLTKNNCYPQTDPTLLACNKLKNPEIGSLKLAV